MVESLPAIGVSCFVSFFKSFTRFFYFDFRQMTSAPFARPIPIQDYSSEGDTDDE